MTSYITQAEALKLYPQIADYQQEQIDLALTTSYSLVNSFLNNTLPIPAVTEKGEIPGVIKMIQLRFMQWVLESSNQGYTDELQLLYDKTADMAKSLTKNEIVSEIENTGPDLGFNILDKQLSEGSVYLHGTPIENVIYRFVVTTEGYADTVEFDVYKSNSAAVFMHIKGSSLTWQSVEELLVRMDGNFSAGEEFTIRGIPQQQTRTSTFKQVEALYV